MLRLTFATVAALCFLTFGAPAVPAQDQPQVVGSVEVAGYKATKARKVGVPLSAAGFNGVRGVFAAPAGKAFVVVNLELKPTFAADPNGAQIASAEHEAITLTVSGGQPSWSVGTCDPHGRFAVYAKGYDLYPADEPYVAGFDPVFLVPANSSGIATLTLGATKHEIAIPEALLEEIDPAQAIQLQVGEAKVVRELRRTAELGAYDRNLEEFTQQIVSPAGRYAILTIVAKPKVRNQTQGYGGNVQDFGLLLGKEVYVSPIGVYDGETFSDYASGFSFEQDALGEYNAGKATLVFPLPGAVTNGKLLYLGAPVADLSFSR